MKKPVSVVAGMTRSTLFTCDTIKEAEAFIAGVAIGDKTGVEAGNYEINAPETTVNPQVGQTPIAKHLGDLLTDAPEYHVVATGNAFDGMTLHGPFLSLDDAVKFGEGSDSEWHLIALEEPR